MAKVLEGQPANRQASHWQARDWRRSMSNHVASALIVYTALQIFMTVGALRDGLPSILPYLALVLLVAAIIPACRWFEGHWSGISEDAAHDPALRRAFRRDVIGLWLTAIGLPPLLTLLFRMLTGTLGT